MLNSKKIQALFDGYVKRARELAATPEFRNAHPEAVSLTEIRQLGVYEVPLVVNLPCDVEGDYIEEAMREIVPRVRMATG